MGLCKNRTWMMVTFIWSIDASVYYAFAIIWPDMVNVLYANGRHLWAGWASCVVAAGITAGIIGPGLFKKKAHWILRVCFFIGSALLACEYSFGYYTAPSIQLRRTSAHFSFRISWLT